MLPNKEQGQNHILPLIIDHLEYFNFKTTFYLIQVLAKRYVQRWSDYVFARVCLQAFLC